MESENVISALAALAQSTRLDVFRALVTAEPDGVAAGELARRLAVPANTLSSHLSVLARAGLIRGERRSRTIIYRAELAQMRELVGFLLKDCCNGRADLCAPLVETFTCSSEKESCP